MYKIVKHLPCWLLESWYSLKAVYVEKEFYLIVSCQQNKYPRYLKSIQMLFWIPIPEINHISVPPSLNLVSKSCFLAMGKEPKFCDSLFHSIPNLCPLPGISAFLRKEASWWFSGKESTCNTGDTGDQVQFPGEGNGYALQYSCLGNPMDRGSWQVQSMGLQRPGHNLATDFLFRRYRCTHASTWWQSDHIKSTYNWISQHLYLFIVLSCCRFPNFLKKIPIHIFSCVLLLLFLYFSFLLYSTLQPTSFGDFVLRNQSVPSTTFSLRFHLQMQSKWQSQLLLRLCPISIPPVLWRPLLPRGILSSRHLLKPRYVFC